MKNNDHLICQFKTYDDLEKDTDENVVASAVVEDIVLKIKRGDKILAQQVLDIIKSDTEDNNRRTSAMETFHAADPKFLRHEFVAAMKSILEGHNEPDMQMTVMNIYSELVPDEQEQLREALEHCNPNVATARRLKEEVLGIDTDEDQTEDDE